MADHTGIFLLKRITKTWFVFKDIDRAMEALIQAALGMHGRLSLMVQIVPAKSGIFYLEPARQRLISQLPIRDGGVCVG